MPAPRKYPNEDPNPQVDRCSLITETAHRGVELLEDGLDVAFVVSEPLSAHIVEHWPEHGPILGDGSVQPDG